MKKSTGSENASISKQMGQMVQMFALLTVLVVLMSAFTLGIYQYRHEKLLYNVTTASEFNRAFKESIDLKMYYYVIESQYSEGLPVEEIHAAQDLARNLLDTTTRKDSLMAITSVLDLCENLEKKIYQIQMTDSYDDRQSQLENNIYVLTSLIQEYMYHYLYCEAVQQNVLQRQMTRQLMAEIALLVVTMLLFLYLLTRRAVRLGKSITKPIVHLSCRVQEIGEGNLVPSPPIHADSRELNTLGEGVEQMVERMRQLIVDVTDKQQSLRHAELALLQAQVNPHFLYNTMDTIIWLIEAEKTQEAVEMVSNLSNFFRYSLSKGADIITLEEEACQVKSYLQIQQVRYKDILDYEIQIPAELSREKIPKLTLQPLVENALYHGIKLKRGKGTITICAQVDKDDIVLQVRDNGAGMNEERLLQLRQAMDRGERVGFGLSTVHERLKLFFGPDYGLQIQSTEGEGTVIFARIPKNWQEVTQ